MNDEKWDKNVIDESFDFGFCRKRADGNEKATGNKTVVRHIGTRTSGMSEHQHFIVVELTKR